MIRKIIYPIITFFRKVMGRFWSRIFKFQCVETGKHVGVSCFCRISGGATVRVGDHFHSNGLKVLGGGSYALENIFILVKIVR